jgi:hypothetical protein
MPTVLQIHVKGVMESERNDVNMTLRKILAGEGLPPAEYTSTINNLRDYGNPAGVKDNGAGDRVHGLALKKLTGKRAKVAFMPAVLPGLIKTRVFQRITRNARCEYKRKLHESRIQGRELLLYEIHIQEKEMGFHLTYQAQVKWWKPGSGYSN